MIGCLRTRVRKQLIIALYFESELVLKFYNLEARLLIEVQSAQSPQSLSLMLHLHAEAEFSRQHFQIKFVRNSRKVNVK